MKESFIITVKLLPCDLKVTSSSHKNNFLQDKIKLYTINISLGPTLTIINIKKHTHTHHV